MRYGVSWESNSRVRFPLALTPALSQGEREAGFPVGREGWRAGGLRLVPLWSPRAAGGRRFGLLWRGDVDCGFRRNDGVVMGVEREECDGTGGV